MVPFHAALTSIAINPKPEMMELSKKLTLKLKN